MCGHLIEGGFSATIYNRTRAKAEGLLARGARWAETPREVAADADVIFTIVGYPANVREVVLGEAGALAGCRSGSILVDMTTSEPALAVTIAQAAAARGVESVDAPVSGGDVGATRGPADDHGRRQPPGGRGLTPCWKAMGKTIVYQGGPGSGQHTKMVNQIALAGSMIGTCEGLLYAYKAGLDLDKVMQSVAAGSAASWSLSNLGPRVMAGNFAPGFFVEHFLKDLGIALSEAKQLNLVLPGLALAEQLYISLAATGHGRDGTQALMLALADVGRGVGEEIGARGQGV